MKLKYILFCLFFISVFAVFNNSILAQQNSAILAQIVSPQPGSSINNFGEIQVIAGGFDFSSYKVELESLNAPGDRDLIFPEDKQPNNGNHRIGIDTRERASGPYDIILTVKDQNGIPTEKRVRVQLNNLEVKVISPGDDEFKSPRFFLKTYNSLPADVSIFIDEELTPTFFIPDREAGIHEHIMTLAEGTHTITVKGVQTLLGEVIEREESVTFEVTNFGADGPGYTLTVSPSNVALGGTVNVLVNISPVSPVAPSDIIALFIDNTAPLTTSNLVSNVYSCASPFYVFNTGAQQSLNLNFSIPSTCSAGNIRAAYLDASLNVLGESNVVTITNITGQYNIAVPTTVPQTTPINFSWNVNPSATTTTLDFIVMFTAGSPSTVNNVPLSANPAIIATNAAFSGNGTINIPTTVPMGNYVLRYVEVQLLPQGGYNVVVKGESPVIAVVGPPSPPVISNVSVTNSTVIGAVINWQTNIPATSRVFWGPDSFALGESTPTNTNLVTSHAMAIGPGWFFPGGTVYYRARSTAYGLTTNSSIYTLTVPNYPPVPPVISGLTISNITSSSARFSWTTNLPSDTRSSCTDYPSPGTTHTVTVYDSLAVYSHVSNIVNLASNTVYSTSPPSPTGASCYVRSTTYGSYSDTEYPSLTTLP